MPDPTADDPLVSIRPLAWVRFRYRRSGASRAWTISSTSVRVLHTSEFLVVQELRQKYGEVELIELRWR